MNVQSRDMENIGHMTQNEYKHHTVEDETSLYSQPHLCIHLHSSHNTAHNCIDFHHHIEIYPQIYFYAFLKHQ
jgi:hypothetical protein